MKSSFRFRPFSEKQLEILRWWLPKSRYCDYDGIIADGAIRSGKTLSMSISFVMWAMTTFDGQQFGLCGKSIGSLRRNVINGLAGILPSLGYAVQDKRSENCLIVTRGARENRFYLFGGRDESSQALIQGITLAGIMLDEVVLMPESFVNQATSRCSVEGAKLWFNCNPAGRRHFFKMNWINLYRKKRLLYLHFTMDDNLSLSDKTKERYRNMYFGMFYRRYILGQWVSAEGVIYDMWTDENLFGDEELKRMTDEETECKKLGDMRHYVAMDYGTANPMVFLDAYDDGETFWIVREYYWDGRARQRQKTDRQYGDDFESFIAGDRRAEVILDPSANSFRTELRSRGYHVREADNAVMDGIRVMSTMIYRRRLRVHRTNCPNFLKEIEGYIWDEKAMLRGEEQPVKVSDHCLTGDTEVNTLPGKRTIRSLVGKIGFVWCYDEKRGRKRPGFFFGARLARRNAPILEVETQDGRKLRLTGDHRVLTTDGWKRADELRAGDGIIDIEPAKYAGRHSFATDICRQEPVQGAAVIKAVRRAGNEDVYDLSVLKWHNFSVCGGLIVHNCMDACRYLLKTTVGRWRLTQ